MAYTLAEAARVTGKSRATISSAIKSGRIAAVKDSTGTLHIDPAELHRIYPRLVPPGPEPAAPGMPNGTQRRGTDTSVIAAVVRKAAVTGEAPVVEAPAAPPPATEPAPATVLVAAPATAPASPAAKTTADPAAELRAEMAALQARLDAALDRLADRDATLADLREERDRWRQQATALLAGPPPPKGLLARLFGR